MFAIKRLQFIPSGKQTPATLRYEFAFEIAPETSPSLAVSSGHPSGASHNDTRPLFEPCQLSGRLTFSPQCLIGSVFQSNF